MIMKSEALMHKGTLLRVDRFGLGVIASTGMTYAFTFDKIPNYRGEQPQEIGFYEGCPVLFTVANDGLSIKSVAVSSNSDSGDSRVNRPTHAVLP